MLEQTQRISFRNSSVLCKVEPELDLHTGSDQKVPAPAPKHCRRRYRGVGDGCNTYLPKMGLGDGG